MTYFFLVSKSKRLFLCRFITGRMFAISSKIGFSESFESALSNSNTILILLKTLLISSLVKSKYLNISINLSLSKNSSILYVLSFITQNVQ